MGICEWDDPNVCVDIEMHLRLFQNGPHGASPSRAPEFRSYGSSSSQLNESPDFFKVGFDDLANCESFTSDFVIADPTSVVTAIQFPDEGIVSDNICNPVAFTSDDSNPLVCHKVPFHFSQGVSRNFPAFDGRPPDSLMRQTAVSE
jgi:hypothetical protein